MTDIWPKQYEKYRCETAYAYYILLSDGDETQNLLDFEVYKNMIMRAAKKSTTDIDATRAVYKRALLAQEEGTLADTLEREVYGEKLRYETRPEQEKKLEKLERDARARELRGERLPQHLERQERLEREARARELQPIRQQLERQERLEKEAHVKKLEKDTYPRYAPWI